MNEMKATILLADFAQVINNKLYIMGGGWSIIRPTPSQTAIAVKIDVPWTQTNQKHIAKLELLDADYHPVSVQTPDGNTPIIVSCDFEVGRPLGIIQGSTIDVPLAFNIPPIPLEPGKRYIWKLSIDGNTKDDWQSAFSTRQSAQNPTK